jgi:hypothetical protein
LYANIQSGVITDVDPNIPDEFFNEDDMKLPTSPTGNYRLDNMNYIVPSDLFKYCVNNTNTNISYVLVSSGRKTNIGVQRYNYGIYGRIPSRLFKPLTNISSLSNVFAYCYCINPYTWNDENNNG